MNEEKSFAELEAQAQAMINAITAQRNAVQDQCINLLGQMAILEMRLVATQVSLDTALHVKPEPACDND